MRSLLESSGLTKAVLEALPDALFLVDSSGQIVATNPRTSHLLGYSDEELLGTTVERLVPARFRSRHDAARRSFVEAPSLRPMAAGRELAVLHRDGRELSVQIALSPIETQHGTFVVAMMRETPDHVRSLREAEERYRSAIEQAPDAVFVADLNGRYVDANTAACRMLGYTREQILEKSVTDLIAPEEVPKLAQARQALSKPGEVQVSEWSLLRADGTRIAVEVSAKIHSDGRWQSFVRDMTERKLAEATVARTLHELENVLETFPDPVAIRIGDTFAYVNSALLRVLGYAEASELLGRPVLSCIHPDDHLLADESMQRRDNRSGPETLELRFLAKDGSTVPLELPAASKLLYRDQPAVLVIAHDRRERKRLESALALRDRLVTVGTLAAGVGHEINNPLQHVTMNLELLREELAGITEASRVGELVAMASDALLGAERIRKIVLGLHAFARGEREELAVLDPRAVLELSFNLTRSELRHRLRLVTALEPTPAIMADESRLAQVFINLLMNAAQAMGDRPAPQNELRVSTWTDQQGRAIIEVRDNGPGMTPDVRARIFEPFYTTKNVGEGTGLGLAIVYSIVTSMAGQIECESEPSVGTTFRVALPGVAKERSAKSAVHRDRQPAPRARILVVDDEPVVASLLERVLRAEHSVELADDGLKALSYLAAGAEYDLILCDLMMPHMTGEQVYERVCRDRPELAERFVFMTGGATGTAMGTFLESVPNERLYKPFSVPGLRAVVDRVLAHRRSSDGC
jgi:PAS domain S-box-containing protein